MFMRNVLAGFLILFFGFSHAAPTEDPAVAIVKSVTGNVKILRGQTEIVAVTGAELMRSDVVVSGPNATSGIVFKDGTLLTVGASSEIEISRYVFQPEAAKYDFSLYLRKGEAIYSSGKIGKLSPESVSVNTPPPWLNAVGIEQ
jgi:hypothetical protein